MRRFVLVSKIFFIFLFFFAQKLNALCLFSQHHCQDLDVMFTSQLDELLNIHRTLLKRISQRLESWNKTSLYSVIIFFVYFCWNLLYEHFFKFVCSGLLSRNWRFRFLFGGLLFHFLFIFVPTFLCHAFSLLFKQLSTSAAVIFFLKIHSCSPHTFKSDFIPFYSISIPFQSQPASAT